MTRAEPGLVGAYALDALNDDAQRAKVEHHLARCADCAEEIRGFRETAARLGVATSAAAPATLRLSTLAAVGRTRQLAPPTTARRSRRFLVGTGAAVVTAAAVAVGLIVTPGPGPSRTDEIIASIVGASDATMMSADLSNGGTAHLVMSRSEDALVLSLAQLPTPPPATCYEVWLIHVGRDEPIGTVVPDRRHATSGPIVATGLRPGDRLGLSMEPRPGTRVPTTPMLVDLAL